MNFDSALVTGASGFIGRVLVRKLIDRGVQVIALGRSSSRFPSGVETIRVERFEGQDLRPALCHQQFDALFHLAAFGVKPEDRDVRTMGAVNIAATGLLVEAAAKSSARTVVYAGSCSEYAAGVDGRLVDEDWRLTTTDLYGISKTAGGSWGKAVALKMGIAFSWIRIFGVYGPAEAPHRLISDIASRLRKNQIVSLSPAQQMRDLMFVDDVAEGLILAAEAAYQGHIGPYNLCTGQATAVGDVARMVARKMGKPESLLGFSMRPYRLGEPMWMVGRPDRFRALTGHSPSIGLEEGISRTIAAIEERIQ
jgi:UDP-glucose 4-epimerase